MARTKITPIQISNEWWEELGRQTLSSGASSLSVASLPQRKYLKIVATIIPTGGSYDPKVRFNNDSGANYAMAILYNNAGAGAYSNQTSTTFIQVSSTVYTGGIAIIEASILNMSGFNKMLAGLMSQDGTSAANTQSPILEYANGKWTNGAIVDRIDIVKSAGTGTLAAGSELIVLGHD